MSTRSIVEEYVRRALALAEAEEAEDGRIVARIPGFKGIFGYGPDRLTAMRDLADVLEDWTKFRLRAGKDVPVLGDIDFSDEENRRMAAR